MLNYILKAIVLASVGIFFYNMFLKKGNKNAFFILFIIILYPFIRINIIPSLIELSLFDFLVIIYFFVFFKKKTLPTKKYHIYPVAFTMLISTVLIGFFTVNEFTMASGELLIQFISIALFSIVVMDELMYKREFVYEMVEIMKIPIIFSFIFLVCQLIFGVEFSISKQLNSNILSEIAIRYPSYFQDPQKYSQFLAASSFIMLIDTKRSKTSTIIGVTTAMTCIVCILLAGGRAGLTGWILGLIIILVFGIGKYRKQLFMSLILISGIAITFSNKFSIFQREALNDSYSFRMSIWTSAYEIYLKHPILGIGIGNYANYVSVYNPDQFWIANNEIIMYDHPESGYLKLLIEFGTIGFCLILIILLYPIITGFFKYLKIKNILILFFACSIISWLVGFYSVYSLGDNRIMVLITLILCMLISETKYDSSEARLS
jgi:hypothetical protein